MKFPDNLEGIRFLTGGGEYTLVRQGPFDIGVKRYDRPDTAVGYWPISEVKEKFENGTWKITYIPKSKIDNWKEEMKNG